MSASPRVLLVGAGHTHIEVLRRRARRGNESGPLTLVTPQPRWLYSGMVPGIIAGHHTRDEAAIDVAGLAHRARATCVIGEVAGLDLRRRSARLAAGEEHAFDLVSLDVGSAPVAVRGADEHAVPVKPVERLLAGWMQWRALHAHGALGPLAVVGAGPAALEIVLALQHGLARIAPPPPLLLVGDALKLPRAAARRVCALLRSRGVRVELGHSVARVTAEGLELDDGRPLAAEHVLWATHAGAARWLAASGLACDEAGFVRTDATLRSVSHPFVFASGDCGTIVGAPRPKAGVFAVREGPVLAANLRATIAGERLATYRPQRHALVIMGLGDARALAWRGRWTWSGHTAWLVKQRIDRAFVRRYATPRAS